MEVSEPAVKKPRSRQRQRQNRKLARLETKGTKLFSNLYDGLSAYDAPPKKEVRLGMLRDKSLQRTVLFFVDEFKRDRRPAHDKLLQLSLEHADSYKDLSPFLRASTSVWDAEFRARMVNGMPFSSLDEMTRFMKKQEARLDFYRQQLANALRLETLIRSCERGPAPSNSNMAKWLVFVEMGKLDNMIRPAVGACDGLYVSKGDRKCWTCRMRPYLSWGFLSERARSPHIEPIFYGHALCIRMIHILERLLGRLTTRLDQIRSMQEHYHHGCSSLNSKLKENNVTHKMRLPVWDPTTRATLSWPHRVIQKLELAAKNSPMARYARKDLAGLTAEAQNIRQALGGKGDTESDDSAVE